MKSVFIKVLRVLMLFLNKGFSHYSTLALSRMFGGKKDILYSFMA